MEVKANELRINNLLRDKVSKTLLKVIELNEKDIVTYVIDRSKFPLQKGWGLELIPLTEEILLKCGFEKYSEGNFVLGNFILSYLTTDENFEFEYKVSGIDSWLLKDIKYLHQLQNLYFALTNEELTVNL